MVAAALGLAGAQAEQANATLPGPSDRSASTRTGVDYDCADFDNQLEAQEAFEANDPVGDPYGLDSDRDGTVCRALPCPCRLGAPDAPRVVAIPEGKASLGPPRRARVRKVVDGDTVKVRIKTKVQKTKKVQLLGIDAPELSDPSECGSNEAASMLRQALPKRAPIRLRRDFWAENRDRERQPLRYVRRDGNDVAMQVLHAGWAQVNVRYGAFARIQRYRAFVGVAEYLGSGVFGRCDGDFHEELR